MTEHTRSARHITHVGETRRAYNVRMSEVCRRLRHGQGIKTMWKDNPAQGCFPLYFQSCQPDLFEHNNREHATWAINTYKTPMAGSRPRPKKYQTSASCQTHMQGLGDTLWKTNWVVQTWWKGRWAILRCHANLTCTKHNNREHATRSIWPPQVCFPLYV